MIEPAGILDSTPHPLRVLALDIEGGHGGSSRSLLQMLRAADRQKVATEVWCCRGGAIEDAYAALGIPVRVMPDMPRLTALERNSRNAVEIARFFTQRWPRSRAFRASLSARLREIDLLHLNHISLFWLARWVRREHPTLPITMHIRTQPVNNIVARWQARVAMANCSGFVFITENERDHFAGLAGCMAQGQVIYNPVETAAPNIMGNEGVGTERDAPGFTAVCLSNYAPSRGLDRLIDVAKILNRIKDQNIHFTIAGDMHLVGALPAALAEIAKVDGTLADYAAQEGVAQRFTFLGHVSNPEDLLAQADVLLKPTREDNPWGRDILEALGHGVPVASVGRYNRFVETDSTGLLQATFNAEELAAWLVGLSKDSHQLKKLGDNAAKRIAELCDPQRQASALVQFWRDMI